MTGLHKVKYALSVISWVLAGYGKASYVLAYITTLSVYFSTYNFKATSKKRVRIIVHTALFIAFAAVTIDDIAGYTTVPWILPVVCMARFIWALHYGADAAFQLLVTHSFFLSLWQTVDATLSYN